MHFSRKISNSLHISLGVNLSPATFTIEPPKQASSLSSKEGTKILPDLWLSATVFPGYISISGLL